MPRRSNADVVQALSKLHETITHCEDLAKVKEALFLIVVASLMGNSVSSDYISKTVLEKIKG